MTKCSVWEGVARFLGNIYVAASSQALNEIMTKRDKPIAYLSVPRASSTSRSPMRTRRWPLPRGDGSRVAGRRFAAIQRLIVRELTPARAAALATDNRSV